MAPTTQKALVLDAKFGNLTVKTIDVPKPGPGEILVKIQAVSLNPIEWKIHKRGFHIEKFPAIFGSDIAGDVVELGEGVKNVGVGDKIFVQADPSNEGAAFQQYAVEKADIIAKIPDNVTYDGAATFNVAFVAAYLALFNKHPHGLQLPDPIINERGRSEGQTLVILGGSSSVGQYGIQLARLAGFSAVITTASLKHTNILKSLGATHVIDRHAPSDILQVEVLKVTGGQPVNYVMDAISISETQQVGYDLLAPDGQIVIVGMDQIKSKVEGKKVNGVRAFVHFEQNYDASLALYNNLTAVLQEGAVKPITVEVLPNGLAGIPEGLQRLEDNKVSGVKLVVRPHETP